MRNKLLAGVAVAMLAIGGNASADGRHCIFDETPEEDACDHRWQDHSQIPEGIQQPKPVQASGCEIEDYRAKYHESAGWISVKGSATCPRAHLTVRLYDEAGNFLGSDITAFSGYVFESYTQDVPHKPRSIQVRFAIDPY